MGLEEIRFSFSLLKNKTKIYVNEKMHIFGYGEENSFIGLSIYQDI